MKLLKSFFLYGIIGLIYPIFLFLSIKLGYRWLDDLGFIIVAIVWVIMIFVFKCWKYYDKIDADAKKYYEMKSKGNDKMFFQKKEEVKSDVKLDSQVIDATKPVEKSVRLQQLKKELTETLNLLENGGLQAEYESEREQLQEKYSSKEMMLKKRHSELITEITSLI